ncbi:hypothetical protein PO909_020409, partial [Leuciscus waleckii]
NRCSVVSNLFSLGAVLLANSSRLAEISLLQLLRQEPQRAEAEYRRKRFSARPFQPRLISDHKSDPTMQCSFGRLNQHNKGPDLVISEVEMFPKPLSVLSAMSACGGIKLGGSSRVSDSNGRWRSAMPLRRKAFTLACQREPDSSSEVRRAGFSVAAQHYSVTQRTDVLLTSFNS